MVLVDASCTICARYAVGDLNLSRGHAKSQEVELCLFILPLTHNSESVSENHNEPSKERGPLASSNDAGSKNCSL